MKYYFQFEEGKLVGHSNIPLINNDIENKEVTKEEYDKLIAQEEFNEKRIREIQVKLNSLTQDFIQIQCGAIFEDEAERKAEFKTLHNELRTLLGKEPRNYNSEVNDDAVSEEFEQESI